MKITSVPSYPVSIFIAGNADAAYYPCRAFCERVGLCVTLTATDYIYQGGFDRGVIVGLINYPRFPKEPAAIWAHAEALAAKLCTDLKQQSYTIQAPDKTVWFSHRAENSMTAPDGVLSTNLGG